MRLSVLENGHRGAVVAAFSIIERIIGYVPDVMRIMMYRPSFGGNRMREINDRVLYKSTSWSRAQMELFGGFVSARNHCSF